MGLLLRQHAEQQFEEELYELKTVSYTHLDVYKRQFCNT